MYTLAKLVERYFPDGRRLRPVEVVTDYELIILDELDLGREAANACQLRRNFENSKLVYVPQVYWDYTCRNVFVMERISGIAVTDMAELEARGTDLKLLAERGVEIFFTQVFRDSFFHADMHPGNIFVDATDPADPTYIAVDCAIIGSLSDSDQYYLARNLLSIFRRDYREVAQLHVECGWVPPQTRVQDFESAMRAVCEPVFERPIGGNLLRPAVDLPVQNRTSFRYAYTALTGTAAKNHVEHRGPGPPALSRSQPVGYCQAVSGGLGAGTLFPPVPAAPPAATGPILAGAPAAVTRRHDGQPAAAPATWR